MRSNAPAQLESIILYLGCQAWLLSLVRKATRRRIYLETMAQLLPKLGRKLILDDKAKGILPLLQLDGEKKEVKP